MKKLIIFWISPIFILIGILLFLSFYFYKINNINKIKFRDHIEKYDLKKEKTEKELWIENFNDYKKNKFSYPVSEIVLKYNLKKLPKEAKEYYLELSNIEPYQYFCLNMVLLKFKAKYSFKKIKNKVKLILYSKNKAYLKNILNELKIYDIKTKILNVQKRNFTAL